MPRHSYPPRPPRHRRDLRRIVAERFDAVLSVIEQAAEAGVGRRKVVALEVVVDIDLPVALDDVIAAAGEFQLADGAAHLRNLGGNGAEHLGERRGLRVLVDEHERTPGLHLELRQADFGTVPIFHALEFGLAQQAAVERVGPGVIRAADRGRLAPPFGQQGAAMAADVGERAQAGVLAARHQDGLAGDFAREVTARSGELVGVPHGLPGASEHARAVPLRGTRDRCTSARGWWTRGRDRG